MEFAQATRTFAFHASGVKVGALCGHFEDRADLFVIEAAAGGRVHRSFEERDGGAVYFMASTHSLTSISQIGLTVST